MDALKRLQLEADLAKYYGFDEGYLHTKTDGEIAAMHETLAAHKWSFENQLDKSSTTTVKDAASKLADAYREHNRTVQNAWRMNLDSADDGAPDDSEYYPRVIVLPEVY